MCVCVCIYIIYIYICVCMYIHIYIYIFDYIATVALDSFRAGSGMITEVKPPDVKERSARIELRLFFVAAETCSTSGTCPTGTSSMPTFHLAACKNSLANGWLLVCLYLGVYPSLKKTPRNMPTLLI